MYILSIKKCLYNLIKIINILKRQFKEHNYDILHFGSPERSLSSSSFFLRALASLFALPYHSCLIIFYSFHSPHPPSTLSSIFISLLKSFLNLVCYCDYMLLWYQITLFHTTDQSSNTKLTYLILSLTYLSLMRL